MAEAKQAFVVAKFPPRGLSRVDAAEYVGVSPTTFDLMVRQGKMPKPFRIYGRVVWDRKKVDAAIDTLSEAGSPDDIWSNPIA
jgi:predicted DNA-binding transcriptional regulator AlpA